MLFLLQPARLTFLLVLTFLQLPALALAAVPGTENVESTHCGEMAALAEQGQPGSAELETMQDHQKIYENIERRIVAFNSVKDDLGLARYLDSVLLHVELSESRYLKLQLKQSVVLQEVRDLDKAISVGHSVLAGARYAQLNDLQSRAMANLVGCFNYAGLLDKGEELNNASLAFARKHGFTPQIIVGLVRQLDGTISWLQQDP